MSTSNLFINNNNNNILVSPVKIISPSEIEAIKKLASKKSFRNYVMISLCLCTGLRNGELIGLTVFCISPYNGVSDFLELPGTIAKGGDPRTIPLHPDIVVDLLKFLEWKKNHNEPLLPSSPLFVSMKTKKPLSERDFQRILRDISLKSINRPIHPHVLRHTFATKLLSHSNLRIVQKLLGHRNIQSTQIYTHPNTSDLTEAINKL